MSIPSATANAGFQNTKLSSQECWRTIGQQRAIGDSNHCRLSYRRFRIGLVNGSDHVTRADLKRGARFPHRFIQRVVLAHHELRVGLLVFPVGDDDCTIWILNLPSPSLDQKSGERTGTAPGCRLIRREHGPQFSRNGCNNQLEEHSEQLRWRRTKKPLNVACPLRASGNLQVSDAPEKECGQGQLSFFWALLGREPAVQGVTVNPDSGGDCSLGFARLLKIPLQRLYQLIRTNCTFFWQSIPPLPAATRKYTSLTIT